MRMTAGKLRIFTTRTSLILLSKHWALQPYKRPQVILSPAGPKKDRTERPNSLSSWQNMDTGLQDANKRHSLQAPNLSPTGPCACEAGMATRGSCFLCR